MDKSLLDILVCPTCKHNLDYHKPQQELICNRCHMAYPIRDGIPVMLTEEARILSNDEHK